MGKSSSSDSSNWSMGTQSQEPWWAQAQYLRDAFSRAEDAYKKNMAQGPYTGDYIAQGRPENYAAFNQAFKFGTDKQNLGYVQNLMDKSNSWINQGSDWMKTGADGLKNLSGDQTKLLISQANQFADNPYIAAAVRASSADAARAAQEGVRQDIYRNAASGNALNSDRAALSQGVVDRGIANQAATLSAGMRQDAWGRGLSTAQDELNARRAGYGSLASLGQGAGAMGMEGLGRGIQNQADLNRMAVGGAEGLRLLDQYKLDNQLAKYQGQQNFPWQALNNFYNIIGNRSWGGTSSWNSIGGQRQRQSEDPGLASILGGGLGALGSLFGGGTDSAMRGLFSFLR